MSTRLDHKFRDYENGQRFVEHLGFRVYWSSQPPFGFAWVDVDEGIMRPEDRGFFSTRENSPVVANIDRDGRLHGIRGTNPPKPYDYYEDLIINELERLKQPCQI